MNFLHNEGKSTILHLDIKADNVLIDNDVHARLTDFGLSEMKTVSTLSMTQTTRRSDGSSEQKGTLLYISPEHLANPRYKATKKTDVYAFGILAWQILADLNPYEDMIHDITFILHHVLTTDCRPNLELLPSRLKNTAFVENVLTKSWDKIPDNRPNFSEIGEEIRRKIDDHAEFSEDLNNAIELARNFMPKSHDHLSVSPHPSPPASSSSAITKSDNAISWDIVSQGIQNRGGISRLHYGPFPLVATTEFYLRGIKLFWRCKCMDVKTGHSLEIKEFAGPTTATKCVTARLVKQMVDKGIYPPPTDEAELKKWASALAPV